MKKTQWTRVDFGRAARCRCDKSTHELRKTVVVTVKIVMVTVKTVVVTVKTVVVTVKIVVITVKSMNLSN